MYLHWPSLYGVILLCSALAAVYYHFFASAFELFNSVGYISNGKQPRPWLWQANGQAGASVGTKKPWCLSFLRKELVRPALRFFASGFQHAVDFVIPPFFIIIAITLYSLIPPMACTVLLFRFWIRRYCSLFVGRG